MILDEQQRKRAVALVEATSRAAALVATVSTIIIDYKFQSWQNSRLKSVRIPYLASGSTLLDSWVLVLIKNPG